ncbi:nuclear transport factor 2 family protein [Zooshikella ganghwensis]|uniref:Nuclear transport factor 2 family protein n=2 Tax=Zooshikella ganghwensis TaxID=202772 RepID=A0A4P9VPY2_9GAMM|nr:nuclear transport factor 2 family protein [Zooshikella ganghwensis]
MLLKKIFLFIFIGFFSMTSLAAHKEKDQAEILNVVDSFAVFADNSAFEYLGQLFTDKVTIDYTSAFGGEPTTTSNVNLMQQWAGLLPGFDLTRHAISNIKVNISGQQATVTSDITASHYLGDKGFWQISGSYRFDLVNVDGHWQISQLTLLAKSETGNRDVLAEAGKLAAQRLNQKLERKINY